MVSEIFPPQTGGSGRWFWEIYRRMPREEIVIAAGEHSRQLEFDRSHDLSVVRIPLSLKEWGLRSLAGFSGYCRSVRILLWVVEEKRIGVVHCGRCLPEGLMALALKFWCGIPYVCYAHGEEMNYATSSRELSWLVRRVLRGARFVIANSRNTENLLRREWRLSPRRIRLLHPGVDTERFCPGRKDLGIRARLGWNDRPVVLTVGRLQKRKGHDQMILALKEVRKTIPDVLYAIVGEGDERAALEALVAREGLGDHVQFLGEIEDADLVRCYQQCDLFVLANRQVGQDIEGFGMVLLEAQACAKAVIAGASGGTAETMRIPETGRVVPCERPHELAHAVTAMLSDREGLVRMGLAARQWVLEHFDWGALSNQAKLLFACGQAGSTSPTKQSPRATDSRLSHCVERP